MQEIYRFYELEKFSSEVLDLFWPFVIEGESVEFIESLKKSSLKKKLRVLLKWGAENDISSFIKQVLLTYGIISIMEESIEIIDLIIPATTWKILYEEFVHAHASEKSKNI